MSRGDDNPWYVMDYGPVSVPRYLARPRLLSSSMSSIRVAGPFRLSREAEMASKDLEEAWLVLRS